MKASSRNLMIQDAKYRTELKAGSVHLEIDHSDGMVKIIKLSEQLKG